MANPLSRRSLITGFSSGKTLDENSNVSAIHPPWAANILHNCTQCGKCAQACPQKIIFGGEAERPFVDFNSGECTFCGACADVCPEPVFDRAGPAWDLHLDVSASCFAEQGIYCRTCGDICGENALRIIPQPGGRAKVLTYEDACSGCGACIPVCPANAISLTA